MLQYLLNTTAIWLISLVMFDVFLRRESYHSYNRFYLLFTFLLGALLPLLQWQHVSVSYPAAIDKPLQQVVAAKQTIVTVAIPPTNINWQLWLTIIYLSGVAVALCLLVIEIIKLSSVYSGKRSQQAGWTVIETEKEHAPFSFSNTLFVGSREQYSDEEWSMILNHEKRHTTLFHIADLFLMQLARIVFWFHPLVYLYNKRLLLVHEYQADNTSARLASVYGKFLIEQAILQSAPTLSHSFNRSPIKNRILMLTRTSSAAARTKMLVFIPLLLVCLFCFSKNIFSQDKSKKHLPIVTFANVPDTSWHQTLTSYDPILSNPQLVCSEKGAEVTGFSISFQPHGKDYLGPFTISGSPRLDHNQRVMEILKNLKANDTERVAIYVEDIKVKYKGAEVAASPIIFRVHPNQ